MTPEEKFELAIETNIPESEYVGLTSSHNSFQNDRPIQMEGYFSLKDLEFIVEKLREYLLEHR